MKLKINDDGQLENPSALKDYLEAINGVYKVSNIRTKVWPADDLNVCSIFFDCEFFLIHPDHDITLSRSALDNFWKLEVEFRGGIKEADMLWPKFYSERPSEGGHHPTTIVVVEISFSPANEDEQAAVETFDEVVRIAVEALASQAQMFRTMARADRETGSGEDVEIRAAGLERLAEAREKKRDAILSQFGSQ